VRDAVPLLLMLMILATNAEADPVEVAVATRVDMAPERVFALVADFDAWERIFGDVRVVRCERNGNGARIRQTTRLAGRTVSYTITATLHPKAGRLEIALDPSEPSDLVLLRSTWQIDADPHGGSQVALRIVAKSGIPVPAFVERLATLHTARRSIDDLARALDASDPRGAYAER
jgi:uncharacterized protein YndB with AHSA1/START domain